MDAVAGTFVDLVSSPAQLPSVLNVVHPRGVSWRSVLESINNNLWPSLPFVPAYKWLVEVEKLSESPNTTDLERVVSCGFPCASYCPPADRVTLISPQSSYSNSSGVSLL